MEVKVRPWWQYLKWVTAVLTGVNRKCTHLKNGGFPNISPHFQEEKNLQV
jgi:hypothetical protein